jgi:hypothetical protein
MVTAGKVKRAVEGHRWAVVREVVRSTEAEERMVGQAGFGPVGPGWRKLAHVGERHGG